VGLYLTGEKQISLAQQSADAATLSAKAAIGMELPVIRANQFPGLINVGVRPAAGQPYRGGGVFTQNAPGQFSVVSSIEFTNHGRTPAFPIKMMVGWKVAKSLPEEPDYFHEIMSSPTAIINPEAMFSASARIVVVELSPEQREKLSKQTAFIWLYVSLHYRDFLNLPHEARFCWRKTGGFGTEGDPPAAYTAHS